MKILESILNNHGNILSSKSSAPEKHMLKKSKEIEYNNANLFPMDCISESNS